MPKLPGAALWAPHRLLWCARNVCNPFQGLAAAGGSTFGYLTTEGKSV